MRAFMILLGCFALTAAIDYDSKRGKDFYSNYKTAKDYGYFGPNKFGYGYDVNYDDMKYGFTDLKHDFISDRYLGYGDLWKNRKDIGDDSFDKDFVHDNIDFEKFKTPDFNFGGLKDHILKDKDLLRKQKFILDVLRNVYTTLVIDDVRDGYHFVEGEKYYTNYDRVYRFFLKCHGKTTCMLPRGEIFSIHKGIHRRETIALFNLFFYSKDFDVFQKNVLWARNYVNQEMFVYALTAVIFHRDDLIGIKLPAHYEILPHKFHNGLTISQAVNMKMGYFHDKNSYVLANYTSDIFVLNDESKLAYFTEDIGWNLFHFYFHMAYPFWLGGEDFHMHKERRGERFFYILQQILARYYLERLSNGLGSIRDISFHVPIKTGYNSYLRHFNGLPYTYRKNYYNVYDTEDFYLIDRVTDYERRIRDVIDLGYCPAFDGGKVDLKGHDGIDILGNLIQSNGDSVNEHFVGGWIRLYRKLLGGGYLKYADHTTVLPSAMEYYETALRDPVTYQLYKRVLKLFHQYKHNLPAYTMDDLFVKGIRIENIFTSKLVTYFDHFDVDISTIVNHDLVTGGSLKKDLHDDTFVHARHMRLNHKPFHYNIDVVSDHAQKVVIRTFIGPKFDEFGKIISLKDNRYNFVEIDKIVYDLPAGRVTIKRESRDFIYSVADRTTYVDLYKKILLNKDINMLVNLNIDESHCGYPDRLLLPKGWVDGMPMQIFVIFTQAKDTGKHSDDYINVCGRHSELYYADNFPLGFPFDRRIVEQEFYTTNMLFKDIVIYHSQHEVFDDVDYSRKFSDKYNVHFGDKFHTDVNLAHSSLYHV